MQPSRISYLIAKADNVMGFVPTYQKARWRDPKKKKAMLERVSESQNHRCAYCYKVPDKPTLDHIIAACRGGTNTYDNLVLACEKCNSLKGHMDAQMFYEITHSTEKWLEHKNYIWVYHPEVRSKFKKFTMIRLKNENVTVRKRRIAKFGFGNH